MLIDYEGKWVDCFKVELVTYSKNKNHIGKIRFITPCIEYYLSREQWKELREKILEVEI